MRKVDVVILARINDPVQLTTTSQFTTVVPVELGEDEPDSQAVEYALEIADPSAKWQKY